MKSKGNVNKYVTQLTFPLKEQERD